MRLLMTIAAGLALSVAGLAQDQKTQIKKVPAQATSPASGVEMFRAYCAAGHGLDAKGTGPAASALKKAPADLTLPASKNRGKFPMASVQNVVQGAISSVPSVRARRLWTFAFAICRITLRAFRKNRHPE